MIVAVIAGPILAVQAQKFIERLKENRNRKMSLFQTLMATRATRTSQAHVSALNMIDIEFYGEKKITNSWKIYNDHLNTKFSEDRLDAWADKGDELFTALLYSMSQYLGYDFDEVQLKRDCYKPVAHGDVELDQQKIREGLCAVLDGNKSIPMAVTYLPPYHPIEPEKSDVKIT